MGNKGRSNLPIVPKSEEVVLRESSMRFPYTEDSTTYKEIIS